MVSMKLCNFVVFVLGLLIGGAIMGASARFPMEITEQGPGPGFWPFLLGLALTVAALALAVYTLYHRHALAEEKVALGTAANRQVYVVTDIGLFGNNAKGLVAHILGVRGGKSYPHLGHGTGNASQ